MVCVSGDLLFTLSTGTLENIKREVKKIVSNSLLMAVMLLLVLHVSFSFVSSCVSLVCTHLMLKFFLYAPTSINPGSVALFHKLWFDLFISLSLEMVFPTTAPSSLGKKKKKSLDVTQTSLFKSSLLTDLIWHLPTAFLCGTDFMPASLHFWHFRIQNLPCS